MSFYATNAQTPVKLRMAEGFPFDREPELVQTMVRRTVKNFPNNTAIAYKGRLTGKIRKASTFSTQSLDGQTLDKKKLVKHNYIE